MVVAVDALFVLLAQPDPSGNGSTGEDFMDGPGKADERWDRPSIIRRSAPG